MNSVGKKRLFDFEPAVFGQSVHIVEEVRKKRGLWGPCAYVTNGIHP